MNNQELNEYIKTVVNFSFDANKYFNDSEPWAVKKKDPERMNAILFTIVEQIKNISILLNPIIPNATNKVLNMINISDKNISIDKIKDDNILNNKKELGNLEILFNKLKMIIDSHCHLNYEPMSLSLKETIDRANKDGVKYLLTISTEDKSFDKILNIISKNKCVYGSYGIHPHEAKNHKSIKSEDIIKKTKLNKKIIGIGESGLDFYYNHSDKKDQIKCFEEHITAAQNTQLPLIVHTRNAETETFEILKNKLNEKNFKILIHCFTGSKDFAFKLLRSWRLYFCKWSCYF